VSEGAWHLRKAKSLVKLLALAPGHALHREQLMELLWPNLGERAATNNLRGSLHAARAALASDPVAASRYLASKEERIALCPDVELWVDVETFEEAAGAARRSREPAAYRAAIELYVGDLLPEDRYEEWAEGRRGELVRTYLTLLVELAGTYEERAEYDSAIEVLQKVVAEESTSEEAHVRLMRLHALLGRKAEALAQYVQLEETLLGELGTEPATSSRAFREEIAAGRFPLSETPSLGSAPRKPPEAAEHNLPAPRTSFVGREHELVEVKRALAMTRLLTLTGAGGSGKTRLALEVARDLVGAYPDGVGLVELAPLSEGELVPQAVASALGVLEQPSRSLTATLTEALQTKQALLVVDNCEHLIEAVAHLVDALLDACPRLRILATSREALSIAGEAVWLVLPLSVPEQQHSSTVEELEGYESVRLLVERARRRNPAFALTSENAEAVAEICQRLEGIPLAIELAASRVGLSAEEIAARLEDSLRLLTGGSRTALHRQQTLRGTLDWSHDLLSEPERFLFRRLSVFAGGWTLEAAEEVGADGSIEGSDVLDLLGRLVDKSLVVAETEAQGAVRYRMLEPIRQYARERLEESEEAEAIQRRHAEFFLALAEEAEPEVEGPQQAAWLERLEAEHDNLRATLSWSLERGEEAELGLRVAGALGQFWYLRGYLGEGRRWLEEALAKSSPASTAARANALHRLSFLAYLQGDLDRAQEASEEGLKLEGVEQFWNIADRRSAAAGLRLMLGIVASVRGDSERAIQLYEKSLALSRKVGDKRGIADNLLLLGIEMRSWGNFEKARDLLEEGMVVAREVGDPELLAAFLNQLCDTFVLQGDLERATVVGEKAVAICREQNHRILLSDALCNLGWAALLRGDPGRATTLYAESLELKRELGENPLLVKLTVALPETLDGLACVAVARGETERAVRLFGATRALHKQVRDHLTLAREYAALREPYLAATRSQLSEEAWETAFAEGRAMGFEETVEYALSDEETATPLTTVAEQSSADKRPPTLTRREREVANLLERRFTSRHIASELHISEHTVDKHVANILRKLNLHSREQVAVQMAKQRSHPF
jgi:predicted ATPase/DNA-binding SARP family transcriptional activator/DNA-binding NarL/FixJ family response regulator